MSPEQVRAFCEAVAEVSGGEFIQRDGEVGAPVLFQPATSDSRASVIHAKRLLRRADAELRTVKGAGMVLYVGNGEVGTLREALAEFCDVVRGRLEADQGEDGQAEAALRVATRMLRRIAMLQRSRDEWGDVESKGYPRRQGVSRPVESGGGGHAAQQTPGDQGGAERGPGEGLIESARRDG